MAIVLEDNARTVAVAAITGLIDAGSGAGNIEIATSDTFGTPLAEFVLNDPAFTSGSAGVQNMDVTPAITTTASGSGTATHYRVRDSDDNVVWTGEVKTTADGSDIVLANAAKAAALDAIDTLVNTGSTDAAGDLQIATSSGYTTGLLITIPLNNPAFDAANGSAGTMALDVSPAVTAAATGAGTATQFRIRNCDNTVVLSGTVGTSGTDMIFNNAVFGIGSTITITGFTITLPASTGSAGPLVFSGGVAFTSGETLDISSASYTQPAS